MVHNRQADMSGFIICKYTFTYLYYIFLMYLNILKVLFKLYGRK